MSTNLATACLCKISASLEATALCALIEQLTPTAAMAFARCSAAVGQVNLAPKAAFTLRQSSQLGAPLLSVSSFQGVSLTGVLTPHLQSRVSGRRSFSVSASSLNRNTEYVIVGGGNAAGYAAKAFVDNDQAAGKLAIISSEEVAPYERPTLSKGYLFPIKGDAKPPRLPGFHTTVGTGGERQTPEWYEQKGIELLLGTTISGLDLSKKELTTSKGDTLSYKKLIVATGSTASRLPEKIGGALPGVNYIRNVADADGLVKDFQNAKKVVVIGGGYIGMEVSAAALAWGLDVTLIFPEPHFMPRLFTPGIAAHYHKLYESLGANFVTGASVERFEAGPDGRVAKAIASNKQEYDADLIVVGVGAKPAVQLFLDAGLDEEAKGIKVNDQLQSSNPDVYAIGDTAAFPIKILGSTSRVEHVDHARKSAAHVVKAILDGSGEGYDYLPYFYSRVFEHPGTARKVWWQFYGENKGEVVDVGDFDPKLAAFWVDEGTLKGVFLESGAPEEFKLLPEIARMRPKIDIDELKKADTVEKALETVKKAMSV
ncbi:Monodehydroascorbate reductase [Klebsormidium nitens]|uniref:monodehydroascorbate reductase (NADH) n=1 Tax=Klebsormidium nitens TaxID=105231 RepID=A0A1Y1I754_KLENI|nr:Monodehydroascorbate reductase [Klebsormidium nitens]|eukprot:GAQ83938.1 Monodehydroascorbate reductase [Klebsormidium nitens]